MVVGEAPGAIARPGDRARAWSHARAAPPSACRLTSVLPRRSRSRRQRSLAPVVGPVGFARGRSRVVTRLRLRRILPPRRVVPSASTSRPPSAPYPLRRTVSASWWWSSFPGHPTRHILISPVPGSLSAETLAAAKGTRPNLGGRRRGPGRDRAPGRSSPGVVARPSCPSVGLPLNERFATTKSQPQAKVTGPCCWARGFCPRAESSRNPTATPPDPPATSCGSKCVDVTAAERAVPASSHRLRELVVVELGSSPPPSHKASVGVSQPRVVCGGRVSAARTPPLSGRPAASTRALRGVSRCVFARARTPAASVRRVRRCARHPGSFLCRRHPPFSSPHHHPCESL